AAPQARAQLYGNPYNVDRYGYRQSGQQPNQPYRPAFQSGSQGHYTYVFGRYFDPVLGQWAYGGHYQFVPAGSYAAAAGRGWQGTENPQTDLPYDQRIDLTATPPTPGPAMNAGVVSYDPYSNSAYFGPQQANSPGLAPPPGGIT